MNTNQSVDWLERAAVWGLSNGAVLAFWVGIIELFSSAADRNSNIEAGMDDLIFGLILVGLPMVDSRHYDDIRRLPVFVLDVVVTFISMIIYLLAWILFTEAATLVGL